MLIDLPLYFVINLEIIVRYNIIFIKLILRKIQSRMLFVIPQTDPNIKFVVFLSRKSYIHYGNIELLNLFQKFLIVNNKILVISEFTQR